MNKVIFESTQEILKNRIIPMIYGNAYSSEPSDWKLCRTRVGSILSGALEKKVVEMVNIESYHYYRIINKMAIDQGIITQTNDANGYVCYVRRPADQTLPLIDLPLGDARTDLPQYCPPYKGDICIGGL